MQSNGRAELKATGRFIDAVLGLHSPVLMSRHQENNQCNLQRQEVMSRQEIDVATSDEISRRLQFIKLMSRQDIDIATSGTTI